MRSGRALRCLLSMMLIAAGCASNHDTGQTPATREAGLGAQPSEPESSSQFTPAPLSDIDYSEEVYRVVADKDEVCTVLRNGLTIIAKRIPSPVISVQGLCHTGSIYEGKWLGGGLSHLLEHLLAGGTNERRTEQQNRDMLENLGGNSNAQTGYDTTVFFVNTTGEHMAEAVDLVTGWMFTSKIPVSEYKREYEVVQRELEKDNGEADWVFYQLGVYNRYVQSPARMPVVGYQEVIRGLSRDDVYAYYKQSYVPQNIVIGVAGNADPEEMVKAVRKYAGNIAPGRVPQKAIAIEPPVISPRSAVATFPKLGQAKLEIAFPSTRQTNRDVFAMDLLAIILGQGESSILVEELRDKQHLVSAISCSDYTPTYVDGTFAIDMDLAPDKIKPATEAVLAILDKIKKEGVSEDRLKRAKTQMKTADAFNRQSAEAVSTTLVFSYLNYGYPEDIELENVLKVTAAQIKAVANKYFDRGKLLTSTLLPAESFENLPAAEKLLRQAVPTTQKAPTPEGAPTVTRVELENNTVLLLKRVATAPVVSVQLYSLGGLTAEDSTTNGIGNLAMQCAPRGTKTRTAGQISEFFDSIGGQLQTTSGNNSWAWNAQFVRDDLPAALEVFADVVKNPIFPDDEVKEMKERTQAAIDEQDRDWFAGGNRFFHKVFFGPEKSPYQFTVIGTKEIVEKFTPDQLRQWYSDKVLKGKRVLAIYGDIDVNAVKQLAEKYFGKEPDIRTVTTVFHARGFSLTGEQKAVAGVNVEKVDIQKWDNPEAAVFVGFKSDSLITDGQRDPLIMADTLTSGFTYPCGYIFETLRGLGLVYDANAQNFWGLDSKLPGTFWAYAACDPKHVDACIDGILLNIARLQGTDQEIDMVWFARAKNLIASVDAMENETAASQAATSALDELYGLGYDYHAKFADRIKALTVEQVREVARLRLRTCVIAVSTAKPELIKTKAGQRKYESFPPVDLTPQGVQHDTGGK